MSLQEVKLSRRVKRISLQRFVTTKIVYEVEKVKFPDLLVLFQNQIWLEEKCRTDYDFQRKFGSSLEVLSNELKKVNISKGFTLRALKRFSLRLRENLQSFLIPPRNYPQFKSRFGGAYQLVEAKQPGRDKKTLPQTARIGKGYRDKGTLKNPALDGSPNWQEVASRAGQLSLATQRIKNAKNFDQIKRAFLDVFGYTEADYERGRDSDSQTSSKETSGR